MYKSKIARLGIVFGTWLMLSSWGYQGHEMIGENSAFSFNNEMAQFESWATILANHSGDADRRKSWDTTEGIKHYIDVDNYPEFAENGSISQNMDSLIAKHGRDFIFAQGILPWATVQAFDSLIYYFKAGNFDRAAFVAADLSHYVGDGHMPLHTSSNYDGQLTNNKGIHGRYESAMINKYADQIKYKGGDVKVIQDVPAFVFSYIYESAGLVDSILHADDYAKSVNDSVNSSAYTDALWQMTDSLTISQFQKSSFALAELVYTAWVKAGSPSFSNHTFAPELFTNNQMLYAVYYADSLLVVEFGLKQASDVSIDITNLQGEKFISRDFGFLKNGNHLLRINPAISKGVYILSLNHNGIAETQKFSIR